mgnify:CR=1 FL=1
MEATARLLEEHQGKGVRMSDVAREAGLSRQAVYLHFGNRANLLVETARYGDMVHRGPERIRAYQEAPNALARLDVVYAAWIAGVRGLGEEGLARACGPAEGPYADLSMAALVLHINREAIHHGAEIALLRDLYAHRDTLGAD